jgi:hypothetical protein
MPDTAPTPPQLTADEVFACVAGLDAPTWLIRRDEAAHAAQQCLLGEDIGPLLPEDFTQAEAAIRQGRAPTRAAYVHALWQAAAERQAISHDH